MEDRSLALKLIRLHNGVLVPITCHQPSVPRNRALVSSRIATIGSTGDRP